MMIDWPFDHRSCILIIDHSPLTKAEYGMLLTTISNFALVYIGIGGYPTGSPGA